MNKKTFILGLVLISGFSMSQHRKHYRRFDPEKTRELEDIHLEKSGNPNKARVLTSKANIPTIENPQPVAIVSHEIIEQQQARQLSEVLQNVNGLYVTSARGGAQDTFGGRGFIFGQDNIFKNGSRVNAGVFPEVQGLERVEVLKGGNAMLYGNTAAGGVINMVTKKPRFYEFAEVGTNIGSFDTYKPFVDINTPLSKSVAIRVNGAYEKAGSFREVVNSQKHYFNPSIAFNISEGTQLIVEADYLKHRSTPDFGIGSITERDGSYRINDKLPDTAFIGPDWQYQDVQQTSTTVTLNSRLSPKWDLNIISAYQNYTRDYFSSERIQFAYDRNNRISWVRPLGRSYSESNYASSQINLNGDFATGHLNHKILFGADGDYTQGDSYTYKISGDAKFGSVFLDDPSTWRTSAVQPATQLTGRNRSPMYRAGVYLQDFLSITPNLKVLAGVRYSFIENRVTQTLLNQDETRGQVANTYRAFSPKFGIVYKVDENFSFFGNYTNSFVPNTGVVASEAQIARLDLRQSPAQVGQALNSLEVTSIRPSKVDQFEIGIKKNFFHGALAVNATAYQITNKDNYQSFWYTDANGAVQTPNNAINLKTYAGTVRSRGAELDITGNPTRQISLIGGVSYNHTAYIDTPADGFIENQRLARTPSTTANLSAFYAFNELAKGLKIGATVYYIGGRLAGWNDTKQTLIRRSNVTRLMDLPDYATLALSAAYNWKNFSLQAKVNNVTGTRAYVVHENYSVNPLAPRNFYITLTYKL